MTPRCGHRTAGFPRWPAALLTLGIAGCTFDPNGVPFEPSTSSVEDAHLDDDADTPVTPCLTVTAAITVDGVAARAGDTNPATTVLVGDTVTLSARGSCGQGPLRYEWQVSPPDATGATAKPGLTAETLTLYPTRVQDYVVTLIVRDDRGEAPLSVFGFRANGFSLLDKAPDDVRDLTAGDGSVWAATGDGAFRGSADAPGTFTEVNGQVDPELPSELGVVHYDADHDVLWLAGAGQHLGIWRADYGGNGAPSFTRHTFNQLLSAAATVRDITTVTSSGGIAVATSLGLAYASVTGPFASRFIDAPDWNFFAVAAAGNDVWVGSDRLTNASQPSLLIVPFDPPLPATVRVLAVDPDGAQMWVGNDSKGVAVVRTSDRSITKIWTDGDGMTSSAVRAIAIEPSGPFAGDVWVATQRGVSRYKRDREVWVACGNLAGLESLLDLRAIAVEVNGARRSIWTGGNRGIAVAQTR